MELRLKVARGSYTITAVKATMFSHPHEDCADIESAFDQLIGLSIMRGYTRRSRSSWAESGAAATSSSWLGPSARW